MSQSRLIPLSYYNPAQEMRLTAYADTIIFEPDGGRKILRAIRFGGYPEMVNAMADAIYAGARIEARIGGQLELFEGEAKRFDRQFSHDGVYAEATLLAKDDQQDTETNSPEKDCEGDASAVPPRKCVIFCPKDDRNRLFEELDSKTAVPLIPEFREYVLDELQNRGFLRQLTVLSLREKIDAWVLLCEKNDANIISVVEEGLKNGAISIPGEVKNPNGFDTVV